MRGEFKGLFKKNKKRHLDCALFCCKTLRKRLARALRDLDASCVVYNRTMHTHDEFISCVKATPIYFLFYLCLPLIDIFFLHISSHSEICYFTSFIFSDQHVTSCEVSVDDLTKRRKNRPSKIICGY